MLLIYTDFKDGNQTLINDIRASRDNTYDYIV